MRSVPPFVSTSTPRASTWVTRAFIRSSTPRSSSWRTAAAPNRSPKAASGSLPPSSEHHPHGHRIERRELTVQAPAGQLADLPGELDSGGTGSHDDEGEPFPPFLGSGGRLGDLERAQDAAPQLHGVVDRLHAGRVERELVVAEVGLTRPRRRRSGCRTRARPVLRPAPGSRARRGVRDRTPRPRGARPRRWEGGAARVGAAARSARAGACRSRPGTAAVGRDGGSVGRPASPRRPRRDRGNGPRATRRNLPRPRPRGASLVLHACARRRRPFTGCSCRRARLRHLVPRGARLTRCRGVGSRSRPERRVRG